MRQKEPDLRGICSLWVGERGYHGKKGAGAFREITKTKGETEERVVLMGPYGGKGRGGRGRKRTKSTCYFTRGQKRKKRQPRFP